MLSGLLSNFWSILLVVLFFGGSILVHELGHFWAARRRGVKVLRFSIGFGPKIFSWHGKDGVEYRLSWLPLGGYVALPQLADMSGLEGEGDANAAKLPELTYSTKMIVFAAGAAMNIVFAFLLACIVWKAGLPTPEDLVTTRIGYVTQTMELPDKSVVTAPAAKAGLRPGDIIRSIDGNQVDNWQDVMLRLLTGSGVTLDGRPKAELVIERDGKDLALTLYPQLASTGSEVKRKIGVVAGYELIVHSVTEGSAAQTAGFKAGDRIQAVNGVRVLHGIAWQEQVEAHAKEGLKVVLRRDGTEQSLSLPANTEAKPTYGFAFTMDVRTLHPSPISQIVDQVKQSFTIIGSLLSVNSNVGLDSVSGPVGIVRIFHSAASAGIIPLLTFTILVNVSLAVFNLLPIPVLDGGHMLFATMGKLRGRQLPATFIAATQSIFTVLLLVMIAYVSVKDVQRIRRDVAPPAAEKATAPAATTPASPASPKEAPAPAPVSPKP